MGSEDYEPFKERERERKERRNRRLESADDFGWSQHTSTHWYRFIDGDKLHYWPSANKWLYRGKYYRGGLPKELLDKIAESNARLKADAVLHQDT